MLTEEEYKKLTKEAEILAIKNNISESNNEYTRKEMTHEADMESSIVVLIPTELRRLRLKLPRYLKMFGYRVNGLMDGEPVIRMHTYDGDILIPTPLTKIGMSYEYWVYEHDTITGMRTTKETYMKYVKLTTLI